MYIEMKIGRGPGIRLWLRFQKLSWKKSQLGIFSLSLSPVLVSVSVCRPVQVQVFVSLLLSISQFKLQSLGSVLFQSLCHSLSFCRSLSFVSISLSLSKLQQSDLSFPVSAFYSHSELESQSSVSLFRLICRTLRSVWVVSVMVFVCVFLSLRLSLFQPEFESLSESDIELLCFILRSGLLGLSLSVTIWGSVSLFQWGNFCVSGHCCRFCLSLSLSFQFSVWVLVSFSVLGKVALA